LYLNRPEDIRFTAIRYTDLNLEVDMNTRDAQLIHQYVTILKTQGTFKSVSYAKYEQDTQSGRFTTSLTLQLKEVE
jgi:Tfp pilus assembly protein PilN